MASHNSYRQPCPGRIFEDLGIGFSIAEIILKPIQYYIHERVWYRWIKFGLIPKNTFETNSINEESKQKNLVSIPNTQTPSKKILNYNSKR